jgi:hypothetical protein
VVCNVEMIVGWKPACIRLRSRLACITDERAILFAAFLGEEDRVKEQDLQSAGPRPDGVPGLLIDEIKLEGIFRTSRGYVAQVYSPGARKRYLIKEGDQLFDGDVVSINKSEVVFKQMVQDPTALKPFREVVKSLTGA